MRRCSLVLVTALCWLLVASFSSAQSSEARPVAAGARYDDLIRQAVIEFDNSHWVEARALFKRAHEINKSARTFRGLGITAFELRRYVDAIEELEASLREPNKPLTPNQRQEAEGLIARAREFVAVLSLRREPANLQLSLEGAPARLVGDTLWIDPGEHTLVGRAPGYEERTVQLRVEPGQRGELAIELTRLQVAAHAPAILAPPPRERAAPRVRRRRPYTWGFAGAAASAVIAATTLRIVAGNEADDYGRCIDEERCDKLLRRGQRHERTANVLWGVGGGLVAAGVVSFFIEGRKPSQLSAHIDARSVALSYRRSF